MRVMIALLLALLPSVAHAAWLEASSPHFVVYANDSEADLRRISQNLERYHAAMAYITHWDVALPSPSNRVTVYVVRNASEVRALMGDGNKFLGGYYQSRAGGSLAIVPAINSSGNELDFSMITLLHEYAHHLMWSGSTFPPPRWYSEGFAEFFSSASFKSNGNVQTGRPAFHRGYELLDPMVARDVTAAQLFDPDLRHNEAGTRYDAFYGKSWLLYHYLFFNKTREGQLVKYMQLLASGKSSPEAAREAFGDLDVLERELDTYLGKQRILMLEIPADRLSIGVVQLRALRPGEAAMMPVRIRSRNGVNAEQAKEIVVEARTIAARFPDDPAVLSALAEAEFDSGNSEAAIAAADKAIAIDRTQVNAYVQKGYALFELASHSSDPAAYARARTPFVQLNHMEPDHPLPLLYNHLSYRRRGAQPNAIALDGLARAVELAPFDLGLRMTLATEQIQSHRLEAARRTLVPVAYNPHGGKLAAAAKTVIDRIRAEPTWDGSGLPLMLAGVSMEDEEE